MCQPIRLVFFICGLFCALVGNAFAVTHQWSQRYGDGDEQNANAIVFDSWGQTIVAGEFKQSIDFGNGALACAAPNGCLYLVKFNPYGGPIWSISLGDSLNRVTNRLAVDAETNIYLASDFKGSVDFGSGAVSAVGFRDGLVAKFDPAGNSVWCRTFGGKYALVEVEVMDTDRSGNIYVAGKFTGTIDFGGATLSQIGFSANTYLVKFDRNGDHVWSRRFTNDLLEIMALETDPFGSVVLAGYHSGSVDFGGGVLYSDVFNIFLVKFDVAGNHMWSQSLGRAGASEHCFDLAVDGYGDLFITGHFGGTLDLGGGTMQSAGDHDVYLAKFDGAGSHVWSQRFGDSNQQRAYTVSVDGGGNVVIGGYFFGTINFGGGALSADPLDLFAASFDGDGNFQWSRRLDVAGFGLLVDQPHSIVAASSAFGDVAFAGPFKDSVDCGGGVLAGAGAWDAFVVRYASPVTGIGGEARASAGLKASPNPFNPQTTISYRIETPATVRVRLFDVRGRIVKTLVDEVQPAGSHAVTWNARDDLGRAIASGVYFIRFEADGRLETRRIVLLK